MFTSISGRGRGQGLALLLSGISLGLVATQLGCSKNSPGYINPAPSVSGFVSGTLDKGVFLPTPSGQTLSIPLGGSAMFLANFAVSDGTAVVTPGNIAVTSNLPFTIPNLQKTTTFTLTLTAGSGKTTTSTVTVNVLQPPTNLTYANPSATYYMDVDSNPDVATVGGGGAYTFTVSPNLPSGMTINPKTGAIGGVPEVTATAATYTVTAKDAVNQSTTGTVSINVLPTPLTFTSNVRAVKTGDSATLSWDATGVSGLFGKVALSSNPTDASLPTAPALQGTQIVTPLVKTAYTLSATPAWGGQATVRTINVSVGTGPAIANSLTAKPSQVDFGGTTTLTWDISNAPDTISIDGTDVSTLSSFDVHPVRRETFTLSASNLLNTSASTVTTTVAARGQDLLAGSIAGAGWLDATGTAAKFGFNGTAVLSATGGNSNLCFDPNGNLLVADYNNQVVRVITPSGAVTSVAGKPGYAWTSAVADLDGSGTGAAAKLKNPTQFYTADGTTYYISDFGSHTVRPVTKNTDGTFAVGAPIGKINYYDTVANGGLDNPSALVAYNGKLFIADSYHRAIVSYDLTAKKLAVFAGISTTSSTAGLLDANGTSAKMTWASSMALDPTTGDIYFTDRENHVIRKVTQAGDVTTIAGAYPTATAGANDGSGTGANCAHFSRPTALVRASDGTLYVTDNNNHTVRKVVYNTTTKVWDTTTIAGTGSAGNAEGTGTTIGLNAPEGIALDASGNLFIVDAGNAQIRKLTNNAGTWTSSVFAGLSRQFGKIDDTGANARFSAPNGIASDPSGNLYVADESNLVVRQVTPSGAVKVFGSGYTFTDPYTTTVDGSGNIYTLDRLAKSIVVVKATPAGAMSTVTLGQTFSSNAARGIAVTKDGKYLFVTDSSNIYKFDLSNGGAKVATLGSLKNVNGMAAAANGIYWVEFTNHVVRKAALDLTGAAVVAGVSGTSGFADGVATARFNAPVNLALAVDGSGNATKAYVVDQSNHAIRQVNLSDGTVSTLVGAFDSVGAPNRLAIVAGTLGTTGAAGSYLPRGIAINPVTGDLFVTAADAVLQITAP